MDQTYIEATELQRLPRWACVAFASRCVRRVLPTFQATGCAGKEVVERLLAAVEDCARSGIERSDREVFEMVDGVDDLDLACRGSAGDGPRAASRVFTAAKLTAYGVIEGSRDVAKNAWHSYRNAAQAGCLGMTSDPTEAIVNSSVMYSQMRADLAMVEQLLAEGTWTDDTPFDVEKFGALWPNSTPTWARGQSEWDRMK